MSENTISQQPNLFAVDSLAKMSVSQETGKVSKVVGRRYGRNSIVSFAKFSPDGLLLKMSQGFYQVTMENSLQRYSENFPKTGMLLHGELYLLPVSEQCTSENESSLLPTPKVVTPDNLTSAKNIRGSRIIRESGQDFGMNLLDVVKIQENKTTGYLNPDWLDWLMGFPVGWTNPE